MQSIEKASAGRRSCSRSLSGRIAMASAAAAAVVAMGAGVASAQSFNDSANTLTIPLSVTGGGQTLFVPSVPLVDGDLLKVSSNTTVGGTGGFAVGNYYYVVGQGSTPGSSVYLSASPGGSALISGAFTTAGTLTADLGRRWSDSSSWTGGVPNSVGATASFTSANTVNVSIDGRYTLGTLNFQADFAGARDFSLTGSNRFTTGPVGILNFATAAGSPGPAINVTNASGSSTGRTLTIGDAITAVAANPSALSNARIVIAGRQGLTITNDNPLAALPIHNGNTTPPTSTLAASQGAVRFGTAADWSRFSGDLTLAKGAFAIVTTTSASTGQYALPLASNLVLGTGTNEARLELTSNSGPATMRGLSGNSVSRVVNSWNGSGPSLTLGSYSEFGETYTFNGSIGVEPTAAPAGQTNTPGQIRLNKIGASTQRLLGENSFYGPTITNPINHVLNGGTLDLGSTGTIGFRENTVQNVNPGAAVSWSNTGQTVVTPLWVHNAEFRIAGSTANERYQSFTGALTIQNSSGPITASDGLYMLTADASAASSKSVTINFGSLQARNNAGTNANGSTALYRGTNLGANNPYVPSTATVAATPGTAGSSNITFTTTTGELATIIASSGTSKRVLKGALADDDASGWGKSFATYDATKGIRRLDDTEQDTTYPTLGDAATTNVRITAGGSIAGVTTQTLEIRNTSGSPFTVTSGNANTVKSGTTLATTTFNASSGFLFSGNQAITLAGGPIVGTALTDSEDVVFLNTNTAGVTINSNVTNAGTSGKNGWITFSGKGAFTVNGSLTTGNTGGVVFNAPYGASSVTNTLNGTLSSVTILSVNGGTLQIGSGATFSTTSPPAIQVAAGAAVDLAGRSVTFNAAGGPSVFQGTPRFFSGGEITNSATGSPVTLTLGGLSTTAATNQFAGRITGNLNLVVTVNGTNTNTTQVLLGANTYSGSTLVRGGATLQIGRYGSLPSGTTLTLGESGTNGTLTLGDGNGAVSVDQEVAGLIAGTAASIVQGGSSNVSTLTVNYSGATPNDYSGLLGAGTSSGINLALRKIGTGTLILSTASNNNYAGGTTVEGGTLSISADRHLGFLTTYTLPSNVFTPTVGSPNTPQRNNVRLNGGTLQTTASFTLNDKRGIGVGPLDGATGGTGGIDVLSGTTLTYAGNITTAGNTGSNTLNKTGGGTLLLNGASALNGIINVVGGTLGGSGSVAASVNVGAGAILAPGTSPGTFTINNSLSLDAASSLSYELVGNNLTVGGGVNDLTTGITNLVLDGTLNVAELGAGTFLSAVAGDKWRLFNYSGTLTDNGLNLGSMPTLSTGFFAIDTSTTGQVNLIVAVPEPTSLLAIGAVAGLVLRRRR